MSPFIDLWKMQFLLHGTPDLLKGMDIIYKHPLSYKHEF